MPTPPAAPWTSSRSPTVRPRLGEERVVGGGEDLGTPPAAVQSSSSGTGIAGRSWTTASSACPPPADDRHHAVAGLEAGDAGGRARRPRRPARGRGCRRRAGRRGVAAGELHHVGAVEAGGLDADEQLARLGTRIGVLLDDDAPSRMVAARMRDPCTGRLLPVSDTWRCAVAADAGHQLAAWVQSGDGSASLPLVAWPRRSPRVPPLWRERASGSSSRPARSPVYRHGRAAGDGRPSADPRLPGRRRQPRDDDALAARGRLPHAPGRHPRQRRLLRASRASGWRRGSRASPTRPASRSRSSARAAAARSPARWPCSGRTSWPASSRSAPRPSPSCASTRSCSRRSARRRRARQRPRPGLFTWRCLRGDCCEGFRERHRRPFPADIPYTALYSRCDGDRRLALLPGPRRRAVEVRASHCGMAVNAEVYASSPSRSAPSQPPRTGLGPGRLGYPWRHARHEPLGRPAPGEPPDMKVRMRRGPDGQAQRGSSCRSASSRRPPKPPSGRPRRTTRPPRRVAWGA